VLTHCRVGAYTTVGPFAYLRPAATVGEHCRIGDFVEIKNSTIGDGTKVSHLTYVGDSDLGKDINLGCGVVFVNYDGKTKNRSRVDDHAFVGCNCNLIAPVHIGENAYLAAGSTVVEDVPADALFVARSRGVVKEDWVKRRKEQGKL
jgi:bifunctional UDP-N-acetylglucosamine pyrophosphorylase/glucosamine-1-phosphate N-acetyltransferase